MNKCSLISLSWILENTFSKEIGSSLLRSDLSPVLCIRVTATNFQAPGKVLSIHSHSFILSIKPNFSCICKWGMIESFTVSGKWFVHHQDLVLNRGLRHYKKYKISLFSDKQEANMPNPVQWCKCPTIYWNKLLYNTRRVLYDFWV